ncbi:MULTISPECIES: S41 family peptidase [unclassified Sphingobacterium]|uniref:S41 family peptidase n=1 Tax=unclassified Sphingobacterium TaxID=2609468 RepID=UPI0010433615|nr:MULTISPECIES: S41 family peptidase [unclassified Sphingobacterium]MCS3555887.1 C-terminal processing protease CtpA/Prc [Sphingobacterium sp. JUb21]TCR00167.1 C-terminal processing protease CtpA/Prc [Sphingobacterium sp. JUb20]
MWKSNRIVLTLFSVILFSCEKEDSLKEPGSNEAINHWTLDQMRQYYYWNTKIRTTNDYQQRPDLFFKSILFQDDHYSMIMQTLNSDTYGNTLTNTFGFDMVQLQVATGTIQVVTQVVPFSEADLLGLKRGDSLSYMNNELLDKSNMKALINKSFHLPAINLKRIDGKIFILPSSYISQPVVYMSKIISSSPTVGYIFLSQFDFSGAYSLLEAVQNFKSKQIKDLIVDLRYNPGGQVAFASFCALLFANIKENDIFAKYQGNKNIKKLEDSFSATLQRQPEGYSFIAKEVLKEGLGLNRIYILTGPNTASASEMLINGLHPYVQVIQVGDKTYGKDMASTTISTPEEIHGVERSWHLIPMVYKIYNKLDQGNYNAGILPQKPINEFDFLPLVPIGNIQDPLIEEVLNTINAHKPQAKIALDKNNKANSNAHQYLGSSYETIPVEINPH